MMNYLRPHKAARGDDSKSEGGGIESMDAKSILIPADIKGKAREYYRMGYRDGLKGWAVLCPTRKYREEYFRGYDDGYKNSGRLEVRAFER